MRKDSRGAAAVLRRGVEHPSHRPQPGDVSVNGGRLPAPREGGGTGVGPCPSRSTTPAWSAGCFQVPTPFVL